MKPPLKDGHRASILEIQIQVGKIMATQTQNQDIPSMLLAHMRWLDSSSSGGQRINRPHISHMAE